MGKNSIGNVIRQERTFRNLTQAAAAEMAGISASYLSAVENGKQSMTMDYLYKIAEAFGMSPASLVSEAEFEYEDIKENSNFCACERESQYAKRQERIQGLIRRLTYCSDEEFGILMDGADLQWNNFNYMKEGRKRKK